MTQLELRFTPDYKLSTKEILQKRFLKNKDKSIYEISKKLDLVLNKLKSKVR